MVLILNFTSFSLMQIRVLVDRLDSHATKVGVPEIEGEFLGVRGWLISLCTFMTSLLYYEIVCIFGICLVLYSVFCSSFVAAFIRLWNGSLYFCHRSSVVYIMVLFLLLSLKSALLCSCWLLLLRKLGLRIYRFSLILKFISLIYWLSICRHVKSLWNQ